MNIKTVLSYFWKLTVCIVAFFTALAFNNVLMNRLVILPTQIFAATYSIAVIPWFMMGSLCLSVIAGRLRAHWLVRWMILAEIIWIFCAAGAIVVSPQLLTDGVIHAVIHIVFTIFHFLLPSVSMAATVTVLFQPRQVSNKQLTHPEVFHQTTVLTQGSQG